MPRLSVATLLRVLPLLLMIAGAAMLVFVGSQYAQMYLRQRALEREWLAEQSQHLTHSGPTANEIVQHGLTRLSVPRIDLSAIVVEGTDHKSLKLGPGHLEGTPLPGGEGNAVISAHRDTFFRHLYDLKKGDTIMVQRDGKSFTYEVTTKKIVEPDDLSVIQPTSDNRLTLITCYPTYYIGPAPQRLIVTSKLVGDAESATTQAAQKPAVTSLPGDR